MIDQLAPEAALSGQPSVDYSRHNSPHVAERNRLSASDGLPLHYRAWTPIFGQAEATLVFLHGIAGHGGWFSDTATYLADRGVAVFAPDRRGSGLSGGPRGHLVRYEQALADLDCFLSLAAQERPETPIYLAASGWSAQLAIVASARAQERPAGLILLGPDLFPRLDLSIRQQLGRLICHWARPGHQIRLPHEPSDYTQNTDYLEYVRRDPYQLQTTSASFIWQTRRLKRCRDRLAHQLTLPILLQIGEHDRIADAAATCSWLRRLNAPDRTAIVYRGASHTLDFEVEPTAQAYRADLVGWIRRQVTMDGALDRCATTLLPV
jgi:acylglycerol lipase